MAKYNFHRFDNLKHAEKKSDPRLPMYEQKGRKIVTLLFAASKGDLLTMKKYATYLLNQKQSTVKSQIIAAAFINFSYL